MFDALERKGVLDNTWIIYTSDHGEMGGDHGLMSKCVLYEPAGARPADRPPARRLRADVSSTRWSSTSTCRRRVREIAGAPECRPQRGSVAADERPRRVDRRRVGPWP